MIMAALGFATMGAFVKQARRIPTWEIVFFRSLINLVLLTPWVWSYSWLVEFKKEPRALLLRGIAGCISIFLYYYAIEHLTLANAAMLNHAAPLIVLVISSTFLGEKLSTLAVMFVALAFVGVTLILKPSFLLEGHTNIEQIAGLAGFASAFSAAIAYVSIKVATRTIDSKFIVFSFAAVATVISMPFALIGFIAPTSWEWFAIASCGLAATAAQICMTIGYSRLPASVASPILLLTVVFAAGFGWVLFGEIPDRWSILGGILVALGLTGAYRYRYRSPI